MIRKLVLYVIFLLFFFDSSFSQLSVDRKFSYEINENYKFSEIHKPRRKNFKWINKIGFDSIAIGGGVNDVYIIPHKINQFVPCSNCDYLIPIKEYPIIDFHFEIYSFDFLTQKLFINKGLLIIRRKYAFDYFALYRNKYGFNESSRLNFQIPINIGLKLKNFHISSGINIQFLEIRTYERKEYRNDLLQKDVVPRFHLVPSAKLNYIKKFKGFTAGTYIGADLNNKYSLYRKLGFLYFIK